ncbi:alpha/beta fold hydrolase [Verrucomicrobiales bacterium BCK34]|nr:alpha/beta fold hydrolase [Verrucomicrobiales bacterium BCK34]
MLTAFLIVVALAAFAIFAMIHVGASQLITPKRRPLETRHHQLLATPSEYGLALERHDVTMADGVVLRSILASRSTIPGTAANTTRLEERLKAHRVALPEDCPGTVILLHGRGGLKENMLSVAQRFVAARYRCVVYDARAHGSSEGKYCTFGKKEKEDLNAMIQFYRTKIKEQGKDFGQLCAFGNSLGAAVILQSLEGETAIDVAIATAPFAELRPVIERSINRKIHPKLPRWIRHLAIKRGGRIADFDPFLIEPIRSVEVSTTPLFLIHGKRDGVIPVEHSHRLFEASPEPRQYIEIPTAYHSDVLREGGDELYEKIVRFCLDHRHSAH